MFLCKQNINWFEEFIFSLCQGNEKFLLDVSTYLVSMQKFHLSRNSSKRQEKTLARQLAAPSTIIDNRIKYLTCVRESRPIPKHLQHWHTKEACIKRKRGAPVTGQFDFTEWKKGQSTKK
tara:strand:+ start:2634 stop:2993 length:360 start_codon:yes stop_codon:yes gene_type:complete